ncbi:MAG: RHS repeat-associated core domain-containing protein, partial [Planctomycetota bacterium]
QDGSDIDAFVVPFVDATAQTIDGANFDSGLDFRRSGNLDNADMDAFLLSYNATFAGTGGPYGPTEWVSVPGYLSDSRVGYAGYLENAPGQGWLARNRVYTPANGRWITRDPAGYVDGTSLYQYSRSRPLLMSDPTGLRSLSASGVTRGKLRQFPAVQTTGKYTRNLTIRLDVDGDSGYRIEWSEGLPRRRGNNIGGFKKTPLRFVGLVARFSWTPSADLEGCCDEYQWEQTISVEGGAWQGDGLKHRGTGNGVLGNEWAKYNEGAAVRYRDTASLDDSPGDNASGTFRYQVTPGSGIASHWWETQHDLRSALVCVSGAHRGKTYADVSWGWQYLRPVFRDAHDISNLGTRIPTRAQSATDGVSYYYDASVE